MERTEHERLTALITVQHSEAQHLDSQMRTQLTQVYQFCGIAFAVLGALGPLLVQEEAYGVLLAVPLVALLLWLLALRALTEADALAAHAHHQQKAVRQLLDRLSSDKGELSYVPWDEAGGDVVRRSAVNRGVYAAFIVFGVVALVVSLVVVWRELPDLRWLVLLEVVVCACLLSVLWVAGRKVGSGAVYRATQHRLKEQ